MDSCFVDTNVFLRYLTNDIPAQAEAAENLFRKAQTGKIKLYTNELVLAEIVWTLESYYELARDDIKNKVLAILNTPGLVVSHPDIMVKSILLYAEKNIDFIDACNSYWMKNNKLTRVATFDIKHFDRIEGLEIVPMP